MKLQVDGLFFIGKQLVAISNTGKVVVWQSVQKHWQLQEVESICSYDTAGFFLLLGCTNGSIYYIGQFVGFKSRTGQQQTNIRSCNIVWFNDDGFIDTGCYNTNTCFLADMEKFPVRMKDNDLLVTQLFEDPLKEAITALSVYVTPNSCKRQQGNRKP